MIDAQNLVNLPLYLTYDDVLLLPNYSQVTPSKTNTSVSLSEKIELEIPILASPMDTVCEKEMAIAIARVGGFGIIHRNLSIEKQVKQLAAVLKEGLSCGVAVGSGSDFEERVMSLLRAGAREICIDSAHGHTEQVIAMIKKVKELATDIDIIAGNVATYEGTRDLIEAGAKIIKVGMGPGSICTTRVMSGMGVPQLTAVVEGVRAAKEFGGKIIADGGIKTSGDMVKALAAGADVVMLGSLLAGTAESPGEVLTIGNCQYKSYRGMGSVAAMKQGSASRYGQDSEQVKKKLVPEGIEALTKYKGKVADHLYQLVGGLRAGMAYLGASNLEELRAKAQFIRISESALAESRPHSVLQK